MFIEGIVKEGQVTKPAANTKIVNLSDREAVIQTTNSVMLKKYKDILKTGLGLDLKEYFESMNESGKGMAKDFGVDIAMDISQIEENTSSFILKLAK